MQMCSRCHKRPAVVFVTRMENNETKNEGLCLNCAKELGLPVNNILQNMGVNVDDMNGEENDLDALVEQEGDETPEPSMGDDEENNAPAIDLRSIFGRLSDELSGIGGRKQQNKSKPKESTEKKNPKRKFLKDYCKDLTAAACEGRLHSIIGRETEIAHMIQILMRR